MKFEKISFETAEKEGITQVEYDRATLPKRATIGSAGYDFITPVAIRLAPGGSMVVPTCIKCELDLDKVLKIYPRSGLGFKFKTRLANTVGIIDADYYNNESNEGHIMVKVCNEGDKVVDVPAGSAFCQGIIEKYYTVDEHEGSWAYGIRSGGFGSTTKVKE